jgi:hypothetical protein
MQAHFQPAAPLPATTASTEQPPHIPTGRPSGKKHLPLGALVVLGLGALAVWYWGYNTGQVNKEASSQDQAKVSGQDQAKVSGQDQPKGSSEDQQQVWETDADLLRLAQRINQPNRVLSQELAELAAKNRVTVSELKQSAGRIIVKAAKFDDDDKALAVSSIQFAQLEGIPIDQSTDLAVQLAYDLELGGPGALTVLQMAHEAVKGTPTMTAADGVQLILEMKPYLLRVHELTGHTLKDVVLDKSALILAVDKLSYMTFHGDSPKVNKLLRACGLSSELMTFQNSWNVGQVMGYGAPEWANIIDRYQRGEADLVLRLMIQKLHDTQ